MSNCVNSFGQKVSINDFALGKLLGEGKFGNVYQAIHKQTKSLYALKKVPKSMIKSHYMIDQFILEIKIQSFLNQENLLSLYGFFDDTDNIYLIIEYMEEGTLFSLFKKKKILT
jgi:aurora kinase, other